MSIRNVKGETGKIVKEVYGSSARLLSLVVISFVLILACSEARAQVTIDLRGLPAPYHFYKDQRLATGERLGVGGNGEFHYWPSVGPVYKGKVGETDLNGVYFVNPREGWVVGTKGSIYRTSDRGRTWTRQKSGVRSELLAVSCVNESRCWVTGEDGVILRTTNGKEWKRLESGVNSHLRAVDFLNDKTGLVVGDNSVILRTEDGGQSWAQQKILGGEETCNGHPFTTGNVTLEGVKIFDADMAWASTSDGVARYFHNTSTWEGICVSDASGFVGIATNDGKYVYAVGTWGKNIISRDSGRSWGLFIPK